MRSRWNGTSAPTHAMLERFPGPETKAMKKLFCSVLFSRVLKKVATSLQTPRSESDVSPPSRATAELRGRTPSPSNSAPTIPRQTHQLRWGAWSRRTKKTAPSRGMIQVSLMPPEPLVVTCRWTNTFVYYTCIVSHV